mmetsp:Transcript_17090/g.37676  ORF Transcript_17090/g.37676 Transcript_17090/m.37676 type:complete len:241 (-) Transcript_17090:560-1282(-)
MLLVVGQQATRDTLEPRGWGLVKRLTVLLEERHETVHGAITLVINWMLLVLRRVEHDRRKAPDVQPRDLIPRGIQLGYPHRLHVGQLAGQGLPGWLQLSTMTAPRGKEVNQHVHGALLHVALERLTNHNPRAPRELFRCRYDRLTSQVWLQRVGVVRGDHPLNSLRCDLPCQLVLVRGIVLLVPVRVNGHHSHRRQVLLLNPEHLRKALLVVLSGTGDRHNALAPKLRSSVSQSLFSGTM